MGYTVDLFVLSKRFSGRVSGDLKLSSVKFLEEKFSRLSSIKNYFSVETVCRLLIGVYQQENEEEKAKAVFQRFSERADAILSMMAVILKS